MYKLCFIDTETTGLDPQKNGLIQIAGKLILLGANNENILDDVFSFNYKVKPFSGDIIEDQALSVNKTTKEEIATFTEPNVIYHQFSDELCKYVDKYNKADKFFFVGYNARFDYDFMRAFFEKNDDRYFGSFFFFPPLDVMNIAIWNLIRERKTLPNFKLETVANYLGITMDGGFHDAMKDIQITIEIFLKYLKVTEVKA